jgi:hypothetical protein
MLSFNLEKNSRENGATPLLLKYEDMRAIRLSALVPGEPPKKTAQSRSPCEVAAEGEMAQRQL